MKPLIKFYFAFLLTLFFHSCIYVTEERKASLQLTGSQENKVENHFRHDDILSELEGLHAFFDEYLSIEKRNICNELTKLISKIKKADSKKKEDIENIIKFIDVLLGKVKKILPKNYNKDEKNIFEDIANKIQKLGLIIGYYIRLRFDETAKPQYDDLNDKLKKEQKEIKNLSTAATTSFYPISVICSMLLKIHGFIIEGEMELAMEQMEILKKTFFTNFTNGNWCHFIFGLVFINQSRILKEAKILFENELERNKRISKWLNEIE